MGIDPELGDAERGEEEVRLFPWKGKTPQKRGRKLALETFLSCPRCGIVIGKWLSCYDELSQYVVLSCPVHHRLEFSERKWLLGTDKFRVIS